MADGTGVVAEGGATGGAGAAPNGADAGAGQGAGVAAVTAPAPAASPTWYSGFDQDMTGYVQNKGWFGTDFTKADLAKSMPEVVKSMRGLESLIGRNRIAAPKDINDTEGWNAFYAAGGRPADWKAYDLKAPEGGNQTYADKFAEMAHAEGLSTRQVTGMAQKWQAFANEQNAAIKAAEEAQFINTSRSDFSSLQAEWGRDSDAKFAAGQRAARAFGMDKAMMDKMERSLGTKTFLTVMANIGGAVSEDSGTGEGGASVSSGHLTPEMASARLKDLQKDTEWVKRYQAGGEAEKAEFRRLTEAKAAGLS